MMENYQSIGQNHNNGGLELVKNILLSAGGQLLSWGAFGIFKGFRAIQEVGRKMKDKINNAIDKFKDLDTKAICTMASSWANRNPKKAMAIVGVGTSTVLTAIAPSILAAIGFTAAGPAAGE